MSIHSKYGNLVALAICFSPLGGKKMPADRPGRPENTAAWMKPVSGLPAVSGLNLNQLAKDANCSALILDEKTNAKIDEPSTIHSNSRPDFRASSLDSLKRGTADRRHSQSGHHLIKTFKDSSRKRFQSTEYELSNQDFDSGGPLSCNTVPVVVRERVPDDS